ncbi:MAG: hypothetical protein Q8S84_02420 [bacterium]|nr:hypothetical protein [bacterium]
MLSPPLVLLLNSFLKKFKISSGEESAWILEILFCSFKNESSVPKSCSFNNSLISSS